MDNNKHESPASTAGAASAGSSAGLDSGPGNFGTPNSLPPSDVGAQPFPFPPADTQAFDLTRGAALAGMSGAQGGEGMMLPGFQATQAMPLSEDGGALAQAGPAGSLGADAKPAARRKASSSGKATPDKEKSSSMAERHMWTPEETQALVDGCNKHGVGSWKRILADEELAPRFSNRTAGDLKDRFRTYFPDAYHEMYPNAKTHTSKAVRSKAADGTSIFEKGKAKERRPFSAAEDEVLRRGYQLHGSHWAIIARDAVFEGRRKSTDLRDRFRNAFPELYSQAGYKPRSKGPKKERRQSSSGGGAHHEHAVQIPRADASDDGGRLSDTLSPGIDVRAGFFGQLAGSSSSSRLAQSDTSASAHSQCTSGEVSHSETSDAEFSDTGAYDHRPLMSAVSLHRAAEQKAREERERQQAATAAAMAAASAQQQQPPSAPARPDSQLSQQQASFAADSSAMARSFSFESSMQSGQQLQQDFPQDASISNYLAGPSTGLPLTAAPAALRATEQQQVVNYLSDHSDSALSQAQQRHAASAARHAGRSRSPKHSSSSHPRPDAGLRRTQSSKRAHPKISSFEGVERAKAQQGSGSNAAAAAAAVAAVAAASLAPQQAEQQRPPLDQRYTWADAMGAREMGNVEMQQQFDQLIQSQGGADRQPQQQQQQPSPSERLAAGRSQQQPSDPMSIDVDMGAGQSTDGAFVSMYGSGQDFLAGFSGSPGRSLNIDSFQDLLDPVGPSTGYSASSPLWQPVSSAAAASSGSFAPSTPARANEHSHWAGDLLHRGPTSLEQLGFPDAPGFEGLVPQLQMTTGSGDALSAPLSGGQGDSLQQQQQQLPSQSQPPLTGIEASSQQASDRPPDGLTFDSIFDTPGRPAMTRRMSNPPRRSGEFNAAPQMSEASSASSYRGAFGYPADDLYLGQAPGQQTLFPSFEEQRQALEQQQQRDYQQQQLEQRQRQVELQLQDQAQPMQQQHRGIPLPRRRSTDTLRDNLAGGDGDGGFDRMPTIRAADYRDSRAAATDDGDESDRHHGWDGARPDSVLSHAYSASGESSAYASSDAASVVGGVLYAESLPDLSNPTSGFDGGSNDPFIGGPSFVQTSYDDLDLPSFLGRSPVPLTAPLSPRTLLMGLDLSNAPWAHTLQSQTSGSVIEPRPGLSGGGGQHAGRSVSETDLGDLRDDVGGAQRTSAWLEIGAGRTTGQELGFDNWPGSESEDGGGGGALGGIGGLGSLGAAAGGDRSASESGNEACLSDFEDGGGAGRSTSSLGNAAIRGQGGAASSASAATATAGALERLENLYLEGFQGGQQQQQSGRMAGGGTSESNSETNGNAGGTRQGRG